MSTMPTTAPPESLEHRTLRRPPTGSLRRPGVPDYVPLGLIALVSVAVAGLAYYEFLKIADQLWTRGPHDRNAHFLTAVEIAQSIRNLDFEHLRGTLDGLRVWGPLHGILLGLILAVTGIQSTVGPLPSLIGWAATAILAFLTARRAAPRNGNAAGAFAALLVLASPGHHAFATDVMIESLGACLTMAVLYTYLVAAQEPGQRHVRWLGVALSSLFYLKTNYWMIVFISLGFTIFVTHFQLVLNTLRELAGEAPEWLRSLYRRPMNYAIAVFAAAAGYVVVTGGGEFQIAGREISITSPHNFLHIAFVLFFVQAVMWWRREGNARVARINPNAVTFVTWHILPVAVWFLLPKRLGYFIWYMSPANDPRSQTFFERVTFYLNYMNFEYHSTMILAVAAGILLLTACVCCRQLKSGSAMIFAVMFIGMMLTFMHPNCKTRFIHSWIAAGWVGAGIGLALLLQLLPRQGLRSIMATAFLVAATWLSWPALTHLQATADGGPHTDAPSNRILASTYLDELADSDRCLVVSNVPFQQFWSWTYQERYDNLHGIENNIHNFSYDTASNKAAFDRWLKRSPCDTVVIIDVPPSSPFHESAPYADYTKLAQLLGDSGQFVETRTWDLSEYDCRITMWKRKS